MRNIIIHEGKLESEEIKSIDSTIINKEFLDEKTILVDWFNKRKQNELIKCCKKLNRIMRP